MTKKHDSTPEVPKCSFRSPRSSDWRSLVAPESEDDAGRNRTEQACEDLNQMLLASLKMEHVVVLAGSGCSLGVGGPSMADLWNEIVGESPSEDVKTAATTVGFDLSSTNIEAFLSHIEAFLFLREDEPVRSLLTSAKERIVKRCTAFLETAGLKAHEMFLHRLSRRRSRDRRLKLFTTNYDLCFERSISAIGGVAIDGFSFMAPRRYDPRYFDYDIVRRPRSGDSHGNFLEGVILLHKLHGSVNWAVDSDGIHEVANPSPEKVCLIYPASGKYQQSYSQPFLESISQYLATIREPNSCVLVVGFGFNDNHLSEPLLSAVRSNPHLRLIVVDPGLEAKSAAGKLNLHQSQFFDLSSRGEDVWFINASFDEFAERIPDLKSLTPAERLMKAVQGIQSQE